MRSAADIEDVGWPEPAAVLHLMESTRSCWPSWRANSRSVVATVSVTAMSLLGTCRARCRCRGICVDLTKSLSSAGRRPGQPLDFGHHPVQDLQPRVPETGVGDVHAEVPDQLVRTRRAACAKKVQVVVNEVWPLLQVAVVDRQREQVAEGVRVDVARCVQEVPDVAPPRL